MGQIIESSFEPAWWLRGAHGQTILPSLLPRRRLPPLKEKRIELADGDFIDLSIAHGDGPVILLVHGLEGSLHSHYAASTMSRLSAAGYRPVFMHLRGADCRPNRLPCSYHSGASDDIAAIIDALAAENLVPSAAVGVSLGGNMLLKYLGERKETPLTTAIAVSVPFVLRDAALRMDLPGAGRYRSYLVNRLKASFRAKFATMPCPIEVDVDELRGFFDFDDRVTAPLNGFADVEDYYTKASCRQYLPHIGLPTLILHAADDPFMFKHTVPRARELGPGVTLELSKHGGHVGFVGGRGLLGMRYWLPERLLEWLAAHVAIDAAVSRTASLIKHGATG